MPTPITTEHAIILAVSSFFISTLSFYLYRLVLTTIIQQSFLKQQSYYNYITNNNYYFYISLITKN
ncbi:hypothetical protein S122051_2616 [Staphylococcus aureus subsp. aureus 122051]|nr:hypothetical protein S122051_2616 [Staphylococcus aureus subsp. aureus 122051]